jgi:type II secretory pathway component GspD/PulD (secretin)
VRAARIFGGLALAGVLAAVVAAEPPPPARVITYEADTLTVHVTKVPLTELIDEFGRQANATIHGAVKDSAREVTVEFDRVPIADALHRLLGDQNFALVYGDSGKLRVVKLLGGPQPTAVVKPPPGPAVVTTTQPAVALNPQQAAMQLAALLQQHPPVPVTGALAQSLGRDNATLLEVVNAGLHADDPNVRQEAVRTSLQAMEGDPEVRNGMMSAMKSVDDTTLAAMLHGIAADHAEEFLIRTMADAKSGDLRMKASAILEQMRTQRAN